MWQLVNHPEKTTVPFLLPESESVGKFIIRVRYAKWWGSEHRDFTVGLYSKHDVDITDRTTGETNMLHADGSFPSEFEDRSEYCGMDNDCTKRHTECLLAYSKNPKKE